MCALCWTRQASACEFGTLPTVPPCARAECKVCSICQSSFHLREVGAGSGGRGWAGKLRYGDGLYFAPNSSKSNDYNEKSQRERKSGAGEVRRWRCMFLSTVALGRSFSPTEDQMSPDECEALVAQGYHSIDADPAQIEKLNYAEVVVYDHRQVIPAYLIVYSLPLP